MEKIVMGILYKIISQRNWERFLRLSLKQMNIGNGGNFYQSGELFVLKYIRKIVEKESSIVILKDGICELPTYKETYEIFITTNFLAIKK